MPYNRYPFELPPLPYGYDALEPYIDRKTMHYHHDKHFKTYIDNLNKALSTHPKLQGLTLKQLLSGIVILPRDARTAILNNAGGVYNHKHFFEGLAPANTGIHIPGKALGALIAKTYGSYDAFQGLFTEAALDVFGSGWTCLALTNKGKLQILKLKNQQTAVEKHMKTLLLFDAWEHAYYLKYKNARADYVKNIWHVATFRQI
ncbi:superoxide dismutase [Christensenellaceae bacterium OttesenSCG-928-M15]|nr:superoxide dismutase [Christensenellaceae bacterium OttesenSCG-928-M15]